MASIAPRSNTQPFFRILSIGSYMSLSPIMFILSTFCSHYIQSFGHCAACLAVVAMVKLGFFGSMNAISDCSEKGLKKYYAKHLPEDIYGDNDFFKL